MRKRSRKIELITCGLIALLVAIIFKNIFILIFGVITIIYNSIKLITSFEKNNN